MSKDPYVIPGTNGVLRNKVRTRDAELLKQREASRVQERLRYIETKGPTGPFTFERLCETHRYLFQDVYRWAGQPRYDLATLKKQESDRGPFHAFTPGHRIDADAKRIFDRLQQDNELKRLDRAAFADKVSVLFAEINQLHPFRDGNGRTQVQFISALAKEAGHPMDMKIVTRERMIQASIAGCKGDASVFRRMFEEVTDPVRSYHLGKTIAELDRHKVEWNDSYIATASPGQSYEGVFVGRAGEQFMLVKDERITIGFVGDLERIPVRGEVLSFTASERGTEGARREAAEHGVSVGIGEAAMRDLLPARQLAAELPAQEMSGRVRTDKRLGDYLAAVAVMAQKVFKEPAPIVESLTKQAIETPETAPALRRQLYQQPEALGELKGGTRRFGREDQEREAARAAAPSLAHAVSELGAAVRSIKAELQADWSEFVQREQIAVPAPSEELQSVLAKGEMTATQIAEVARKADLVSEINTFLDKASQRFGPEGMAAIRGNRMDQLRSRLSGIREHDLERAAKLTQDIAKLHERVEQHQQQHERKQEQGLKLTPGSGRE